MDVKGRDVLTVAATVISLKVFHCWQSGQRPSHLAEEYPHDWHSNVVGILAMSCPRKFHASAVGCILPHDPDSPSFLVTL